MAASWPTSIPTDATLYLAVNELQTNLSSGIDNAVTTVPLNSTTSFPTVGLVLIDNEIIKYTGVSGANLTGCTRGFDGTTAASHSSAAVVSFAICAQHHNVTKDEIIALATYLSNNLGTGSQPLANGSRALASNGSGKIIESSVTSTELGYLSGVTSAIQTQLGLLAPKASPAFTGTITTPLTANRAVATGAAGVLAASAVTDTELGYVSGVTSAVQTQLNAKQAAFAAGQLPGTATNDSASAGNVGEIISASKVRSAGTSISSATPINAASIVLTAGDWEIFWGYGVKAGGATTYTLLLGSISTTSGTPGGGGDNYVVPDATGQITVLQQGSFAPGSGNDIAVAGMPARISLSGSVTYYLVVRADFSGSTSIFYGSLHARRVR